MMQKKKISHSKQISQTINDTRKLFITTGTDFSHSHYILSFYIIEPVLEKTNNLGSDQV